VRRKDQAAFPLTSAAFPLAAFSSTTLPAWAWVHGLIYGLEEAGCRLHTARGEAVPGLPLLHNTRLIQLYRTKNVWDTGQALTVVKKMNLFSTLEIKSWVNPVLRHQINAESPWIKKGPEFWTDTVGESTQTIGLGKGCERWDLVPMRGKQGGPGL
jgi:hypothetical protein